MTASDLGLGGRLYRQRRHDGSLTYPVPVPAAMPIGQILDDSRFTEQTAGGLAMRYLIPAVDESAWPFARLLEAR